MRSSSHSQQKSLNYSIWVQFQNDRMISVHFQSKPFSIAVTQVYGPTTNAEEAEQFYEDLQDLLQEVGLLQDLLELTPKKDVLFIIGN